MEERVIEELKQIQRLLLELVRLETMANHMVAESLDALKVKTAEVLTAAVDLQAHGEVSSTEVKASAPVEPLPDLIEELDQLQKKLWSARSAVMDLQGQIDLRRSVVTNVVAWGASPEVARVSELPAPREQAVRRLLRQGLEFADRVLEVCRFEAP